MSWVIRYRCLGLIAAMPFLSLLAGCGSSEARFTPTTAEARTSLELALTAWREGKPYGPVDATPPVQVADEAWERGDQVDSFEIGAEQDDGDGTKQFVVALKMKKPPGDQSVRYFVHGRDPVRVYREENYKRMINMDNNPVTKSPSKPGSQRSSSRR
jgi:hypothetical protein